MVEGAGAYHVAKRLCDLEGRLPIDSVMSDSFQFWSTWRRQLCRLDSAAELTPQVLCLIMYTPLLPTPSPLPPPLAPWLDATACVCQESQNLLTLDEHWPLSPLLAVALQQQPQVASQDRLFLHDIYAGTALSC